jgi:hypothetical protein
MILMIKFMFYTRYNTSGLMTVLVSRSHNNCSLGYMPAVARPTHTRHCICTGVQPTLTYLYRCSTYISLPVEAFNLHFYTGVQPTLLYLYRRSTYTIYTGVQPTFLYLYRCSTYTSPSVQVFNLHFSICAMFNLHFSTCTGVQPTLLYLYTCSTYTSLSVQVFNLHFSLRQFQPLSRPSEKNQRN